MVVIEDIVKDHHFADRPLVEETGIHFCAGERLLNRNGKSLGILFVLDTRPREMSAREKESLHAAATAAVEALDVRAVAPSTNASKKSGLNDNSRSKPISHTDLIATKD